MKDFLDDWIPALVISLPIGWIYMVIMFLVLQLIDDQASYLMYIGKFFTLLSIPLTFIVATKIYFYRRNRRLDELSENFEESTESGQKKRTKKN
jgi:pilus assembly protein TadC